MSGGEGVNSWREEDAFDSWEDGEPSNDDESDEKTEEELNREIEQLESKLDQTRISIFLTPEEHSKIDWKSPESVEEAAVIANQRARAERKAKKSAGGALLNSEKDGVGGSTSEAEVGSMPVRLREAPLCQHIRGNNQRCGSPALKGKRFCYYHDEARGARKAKKRLQMPVLEDHRAIQMALTKVCQRVADESLDPKRATTLFYGLQVASAAIPKQGARKRTPR